MRRGDLFGTAAALLAIATVGGCVAAEATDPETVLRAATVTLEGGRCAGVVAGDDATLLTSAHCIHPGETRLEILFRDGRSTHGELRLIDRARDVAVLRLAERARVHALQVAAELPRPGASLWFTGLNEYRHPMEAAVVVRLGRCPSLPTQPNSLFTTIHGIPGDSGAPLVDTSMRVVGLVHGGAACSIAVPVSDFAPLLVEPVSG